MSLMIEYKARQLLKKYMEAELSGNDTLAAELEGKLNNAGWQISVGAEGYTVIRSNGGLFIDNDTEGTISNTDTAKQYKKPYEVPPKNTTSNTPLIIGISIGGLLLVITTILVIKAIKKRKHAV